MVKNNIERKGENNRKRSIVFAFLNHNFWCFYYNNTMEMCIKYTCYIDRLRLVRQDARKAKSLPGVIFCRILKNFLYKPRKHWAPITRYGFWRKVLERLEESFLKKFSTFSIFYRYLYCPRCEREDQASFITALSRGEVIPFEIELSGKRNCTKKILCLLY